MIPQNWTIKSLKEIISSLEAGVSVNPEDRCVSGNEIGVLKVSSVTYGVFLPNEHKVIRKSEEHKVSITPKKDRIIVSRANTPDFVGASVYIDRDYPNLFLSDKLWQLDVDPKVISIQWLSQVLNSSHVRSIVSSTATGSSKSMKNISQESFLKIKVRIPPLQEQKRIADILATWDEAIALTEKTIIAKEKYRKSVSLSLLNGQVRFPMFMESASQMACISDHADLLTGFAFQSKSFLNEGRIRLLRGINITNGSTRWGDQTKYWDSESSDLARYLLNEGDVVIGMDGSLVGRNFALLNKADLPAYLVQRVARLRAKDSIDQKYLYFVISSGVFTNYVDTVKTVTAIPHITLDDIKKFKIWLPTKEEQNQVANYLACLDQEIRLLVQQVNLLKIQKQGLMQKLLTGEWRVAVQEAA